LHCVENLLWKRLWTCCKTDYRYEMNESLGTPTYENENKTKRQLVMHGDYSSTANCKTEIPAIFRGTRGIFRGILKLLLFHNFLWSP
jgi:hypothetical protein